MIPTMECPECGGEVTMGLPRDATVGAVAMEPGEPDDDPRRKWRRTRCERGHVVHVHFEF